MMLWINFLRVAHPDLYKQFRAEETEAENSPKGERFIAVNAVYQRWQHRANEIAAGKI